MCTLTVQHHENQWLVTMGRDESRSRSDGTFPFQWSDPTMLSPQDPQAGGTWIGVRPDGVWACLLNGYLPAGEEIALESPQTRGRIIPILMEADSPIDAMEAVDLDQTHAFRLWLGNSQGVMEYFWDQRTLKVRELDDQEWRFVTSSSFDQDDVTEKRAAVFRQWVAHGARKAGNGIPDVHLEAYGLTPEYAIPMERSYSHTKSITQIAIDENGVSMKHWTEGEFHGSPSKTVSFT